MRALVPTETTAETTNERTIEEHVMSEVDRIADAPMQRAEAPARRSMDPATQKDITTRLRRARGQVEAVITMIESGRSCREVATQLAAASKALDRAGYKLIAAILAECLLTDEADRDMTPEEIEKLFISLA